MNHIESEEQYQTAMARIEELLPIVKEDTPEDDENYLELVSLSYMVADYEEKKFLMNRKVYKTPDEKIDTMRQAIELRLKGETEKIGLKPLKIVEE